MERNRKFAFWAGLWLGLETVVRVPYFKKMAVGWRVLSWFGAAWLFKSAFNACNSCTYGPLVSAFLRKYSKCAKADPFEITDRKREFFDIDTSQYMRYNFNDLGMEYHAHHGPQPVNFSIIIMFRMEKHSIAHGWLN